MFSTILGHFPLVRYFTTPHIPSDNKGWNFRIKQYGRVSYQRRRVVKKPHGHNTLICQDSMVSTAKNFLNCDVKLLHYILKKV